MGGPGLIPGPASIFRFTSYPFGKKLVILTNPLVKKGLESSDKKAQSNV